MKTQSKPANKEAFERWSKRLRTESICHEIPALFSMECECLVVSYHGGPLKAAWHLVRKKIISETYGAYWSFVYRLVDLFRWTVKRPFPDSEGWTRHARSCDKMNCDDMDCCKRDIPRSFKKLSGIDKFHNL